MRAAVDVGTNTVRLLLGDTRDGRVRPDRYLRRITRLGGGFSSDKGLSPEAMERTLVALREFGDAVRDRHAAPVAAAGTAILRRAVNGPEFAQRVRTETGLPLAVIDGEREACLTAAGVLSALDPRPDCCLVFDIGGGSTEFILVLAGEIRFHRSYHLGVVALCEEVGSPDRQGRRIDAVLEELARDLAAAELLDAARAADCRVVGTAGTVTTLAALQLEMADYDWRRVNNLVLDRREVGRWRQRLRALDEAQREALPGMEKGRGDLIVPGVEIVNRLLARLGKEALTVSDFGLLEGLLLAGDASGKLTFPAR
jgi:exopolyphosphatase/guanosine-5'-triphosphate,3'-diphosphate pyrophosphatase